MCRSVFYVPKRNKRSKIIAYQLKNAFLNKWNEIRLLGFHLGASMIIFCCLNFMLNISMSITDHRMLGVLQYKYNTFICMLIIIRWLLVLTSVRVRNNFHYILIIIRQLLVLTSVRVRNNFHYMY